MKIIRQLRVPDYVLLALAIMGFGYGCSLILDTYMNPQAARIICESEQKQAPEYGVIVRECEVSYE